MARGLVIGAPQSGSGKTLVALGLARALRERGVRVAPAKSGPDYIDPAFLALAAGAPAINLDAWAMPAGRLRALAATRAAAAELLLVEGAMGLFDGAADGRGSTGDLAATLGLPVVLVVDCGRMSQSVAALVEGFARHRPEVEIAGVVLNRIGSPRHEILLRAALAESGVQVIGAIPADPALEIPDRHLGLVLPGEVEAAEALVARAGQAIAGAIDLDALIARAAPLPAAEPAPPLRPLGQNTAVAQDAAFAFVYEHWLRDWRAAGAGISFFSPLADEAPAPHADAVFLPGGYPELHGAVLAGAARFKAGLEAARERGALIYGECGGYMVLGRALTDVRGQTHEMAGLLPHATRIDAPRRVLGYRRLKHSGPLPWPKDLMGHEFHYSTEVGPGSHPLFAATDALGEQRAPLGAVMGRVCGSYAHVIDAA